MNDKIDGRFYVNVAHLMQPNIPAPKLTLPKPRLKRTIICDYGEWLPLISVSCEE